MVLHSYGHQETSEAHLRNLCGCDETGTTPKAVAKAAAEHFGLSQSRIGQPTFDVLVQEILRGVWPIVYLDENQRGLDSTHSVVVVEITTDEVVVLDPELDPPGERLLMKDDFERAWAGALRRTIFIE